MANDAVLTNVPASVMPHVKWDDPAPAARDAASIVSRLARAGLTERAALLLESALALPDLAATDRAALLATGRELLQEQRRPQKALSSWNDALAIDPGRPRADVRLAR